MQGELCRGHVIQTAVGAEIIVFLSPILHQCLGIAAVDEHVHVQALAVQNGTWAAQKREPITDEQIASLAKRLHGIAPAYENFMKMSPSVKRTYTGAYFAPKSDDARQRSFDRIVDRLNKNLKPM